MRSRLVFRIALVGLIVHCIGAPPAEALDTVMLVESTVTAKRAESGGLSAEVGTINVGPSTQLDVGPINAAGGRGCTVKPRTAALPAHVGTTVTLDLSPECFPPTGGLQSQSDITVDLDGVSGAVPAVTIKAPEELRYPWWALIVGLAAAGVLGVIAFLLARRVLYPRVLKKVETAPPPAASGDPRNVAYQTVRDAVDEVWTSAELPGDRPCWKDLTAEGYGYDDEVHGLEPGWSPKDSWLTSLTVLIGAVVALATSTDFLAAVVGDAPKSQLRVMVVAGLISAGLIAMANTLVKLIGKKADAVTVRGLIISTSLLFVAIIVQILTLGLALGDALGVWSKFDWKSVLLAAGILFLMVVSSWYLLERLKSTLEEGAPKIKVPVIPADAAETWRAESPWEKLVVADRIRTTFSAWLGGGPQGNGHVVLVGSEAARQTSPSASYPPVIVTPKVRSLY